MRTNPLKDIYDKYTKYCLNIECVPDSKKKLGVEIVKHSFVKEKRGNAIAVIDVKFSAKYTLQEQE